MPTLLYASQQCLATGVLEAREDLLILVNRLRKAGGIRDRYAHALYSYAAADQIVMTEFFGDARKKQERKTKTIDDFNADTEVVKSIKATVHGYLYRNERPKR